VTHADLVIAAARGLSGSMRCGIVLTEFASGARETPDAIGFRRGGSSVLVECKVSRADFRADGRKGHRRSADGAGAARYYMTPPELVDISDLPAGWGLVWGGPRRNQVRVYAGVRILSPASLREEAAILYSLGRRCLLGECWRPKGVTPPLPGVPLPDRWAEGPEQGDLLRVRGEKP